MAIFLKPVIFSIFEAVSGVYDALVFKQGEVLPDCFRNPESLGSHDM